MKKLAILTMIASLLALPAHAQSIAVDKTTTTGNPAVVKVTNTAGGKSNADGVVVLNADGTIFTGAVSCSSCATAANQTSQITQETNAATSLAVIDDWDESDRAKTNPIVGQAGIDGGAGASTAKTTRTTISNGAAIPSGSPTYRAVSAGYASYSNATDLFCINGSDTKTIAINGFAFAAKSTSATVVAYSAIKRSTANTGGTPSSLTALALDSGDAAATATVTSYAAAPTLGTTVGTLYSFELSTVATAGAGSYSGLYTQGSVVGMPNTAQPSAVTFFKPIILRGTTEGLCMNAGGVSPPAGYAATLMVEWVEF